MPATEYDLPSASPVRLAPWFINETLFASKALDHPNALYSSPIFLVFLRFERLNPPNTFYRFSLTAYLQVMHKIPLGQSECVCSIFKPLLSSPI